MGQNGIDELTFEFVDVGSYGEPTVVEPFRNGGSRRNNTTGRTEETAELLSVIPEIKPLKTRRSTKKEKVSSDAIAVVLAGAFQLVASTGRPHFEKTEEECRPFAEQLAEYLETYHPKSAVDLMKYLQPVMMVSSLALLIGPPVITEINEHKHRSKTQTQNGNRYDTGTASIPVDFRVSDFAGPGPTPTGYYDRPFTTEFTDE